jgi:pimeloyl-ACP methyl ester carboxylesterase
MTEATTSFAEVNGQHIAYADSGGDGPVVILAHGFLMDADMFAPQVEALSPEFRVVTWDERGFGNTVTDGEPFTYWDSAADCLGLLDHLGVERAIVGGMSQGGYLSLRVALTAPERVRGLVLIDTSADTDDAETLAGYQAMVDTWLAAGPVDELTSAVAGIIIGDAGESERWVAKWRQRDPGSLAEPAACLLGRDDITDRLGEITCAALVIHGTEDSAISLDRAHAMCAALSGCTGVVEVPGAAHAANLTHPGVVNPPLLEFCRSLPA